MKPEVKNVLALQAELGECPTWSVREQVLWCVDILAPAIHRFDPRSGALETFPQQEEVGCIGLREQGGLIAALRSGVWLLDEQGRPERKIADNPGEAAKSRFNDGRVDPWGNFWCGSLWEPQDKNGGLLCRVTPSLSLEVKARDIMISNGVAFSPDRRWMYHSDTPNEVLYRYPLDEKGEPGAREIFRQFDAAGGLPDGAAVDSEGFYWSAQFDGGRVVRIDPASAEIVDEIALPVRWPTMVAFGGPDLKTLYITSSREDRTEEELARYPQSGDIFAVEVEVAGIAEPCFPG
ncbi:gluconolactonase [Candidatus Pantoea alvi]|uniref:SMP-30/gluconolactonase/LRE family protein n=1 Tax=Enterobacter agglomerans TaxID=549 RepID=UPI000CDD487F|nr:SMP-30/gluconolactonase/LRE family protein [Pantoea agglomerans]POW59878.1 gluconolactonase [Pantoea alvi]UBN55483.1 SMP-30/gluconolactonase/LRE family protein [Pantoea agglomerans]